MEVRSIGWFDGAASAMTWRGGSTAATVVPVVIGAGAIDCDGTGWPVTAASWSWV